MHVHVCVHVCALTPTQLESLLTYHLQCMVTSLLLEALACASLSGVSAVCIVYGTFN